MERSNNNKIPVPHIFLFVALILLATGLAWGLVGGLQYILPGFLKKYLSFEKVRPLHVSSVVFWIILAASGAVISYMQQHRGKKMFSLLLVKIQLVIFTITIFLILVSYLAGIFGGREYWEFHPLLAIPVATGWLIFLVNFLLSIGSLKNQPVYVWMWLTGLLFFFFTFVESYLWIFPYFRNNIINDMTIQWKSYGSMVGAWNMLIYGAGIYMMDKISNEKKYSYSNIAFLLYFTGLLNLMFNWGHHIYTLPTHSFIKNISYAVSMTELFIFGRIIYLWRHSLSSAKKNFHLMPYRFMAAADVWIFLTLLLAIIMSVPGINVYTHGTHVTVAHTMGATIGVNSFILLAVSFDILDDGCSSLVPFRRLISRGFYLANFSLFIFWIALIVAGILKANWQMNKTQVPFSQMMGMLRPYFIVFFVSGILLAMGLLMIIYPLLQKQVACYVKSRNVRGYKKVPGNLEFLMNE